MTRQSQHSPAPHALSLELKELVLLTDFCCLDSKMLCAWSAAAYNSFRLANTLAHFCCEVCDSCESDVADSLRRFLSVRLAAPVAFAEECSDLFDLAM
mmetsp:Transcript_6290/g.10585  ORF Transcript_6290/g.10585 Transcript_6290/m.10585 type:complete len:98 (-) Transcript_6290:251-544(-)